MKTRIFGLTKILLNHVGNVIAKLNETVKHACFKLYLKRNVTLVMKIENFIMIQDKIRK